MANNVQITKAGYVKVDGVKVLDQKLTPLSVGKFVVKLPKNEKILRLWVKVNYKMV